VGEEERHDGDAEDAGKTDHGGGRSTQRPVGSAGMQAHDEVTSELGMSTT